MFKSANSKPVSEVWVGQQKHSILKSAARRFYQAYQKHWHSISGRVLRTTNTASINTHLLQPIPTKYWLARIKMYTWTMYLGIFSPEWVDYFKTTKGLLVQAQSVRFVQAQDLPDTPSTYHKDYFIPVLWRTRHNIRFESLASLSNNSKNSSENAQYHEQLWFWGDLHMIVIWFSYDLLLLLRRSLAFSYQESADFATCLQFVYSSMEISCVEPMPLTHDLRIQSWSPNQIVEGAQQFDSEIFHEDENILSSHRNTHDICPREKAGKKNLQLAWTVVEQSQPLHLIMVTSFLDTILDTLQNLGNYAVSQLNTIEQTWTVVCAGNSQANVVEGRFGDDAHRWTYCKRHEIVVWPKNQYVTPWASSEQ